MAVTYLAINHDSAFTLKGVYDQFNSAADSRQFAVMLEKFVSGLAGGLNKAGVEVLQIDGSTPARASATITFTHASLTAGDTVTVGGVVFTAVASGATGLQFDIGSDATSDASNFVSTFNTNLGSIMSASSNLGVVTIQFGQVGPIGNLVTLAVSDAAATTLSGSALSGGGSVTSSSTRTVRNFGTAQT